MRLINVDTLELVDFCGRQPQAYAILSHTWGDEEVSFQDIQNLSRAARKRGFRKIEETCRLARARGLGWAWVDTCCIDKSSSAELSEAINSMFQWYQRSCVCFAYLEDVDHAPLTLISIHESLPKSRWFKRGWTLQELLGPSQLLFYDSTWAELGLREHLSSAVSEITNIDESFLSRPSSEDINNLLARASIAERMSWASRRSTSREEDGAYCLLGIFGINIPLLYGEGPRAFLRLQEEIIKRSNDQSIFAWRGLSFSLNLNRPEPGHVAGLLASSPACISQSADIVPRPTGDSTSIYTITNKGLHINLPMLDAHAVLACGPRDDPTTLMTLQLSKVDGNLWQRSVDRGAADLGFVDQRAWQQWTKTSIFAITASEGSRYAAGSTAPGCYFLVRELPLGVEFEKQWPFEGHARKWEIPPHLLRSGETLQYFRTLKQSPELGIPTIHIGLEARRLNFLVPSVPSFWASYKVWRHPSKSLEPCLDPQNCPYRWEGTQFLTLDDEKIMHAQIVQRDIHGEQVAAVDIIVSKSDPWLMWRRLSTWINTMPLRVSAAILDTPLPVPRSTGWFIVTGIFTAAHFATDILSDRNHRLLGLIGASQAVYVKVWTRQAVAPGLDMQFAHGPTYQLFGMIWRSRFSLFWLYYGLTICSPLFKAVLYDWQYQPRYRTWRGTLQSPYSARSLVIKDTTWVSFTFLLHWVFWLVVLS